MFTKSIVKGISRANVISSRTLFTLPDLPYNYDALEPYISKEIMHLHHDKHHQAYVNNLNTIVNQMAEYNSKDRSTGTSCATSMANLSKALRFNAGGHANHSMFWKMLCPAGGPSPSGKVLELIQKTYGKSLDSLVKNLSQQCIQIQGSGWGWLCLDKNTHTLLIETTSNQDTVPEHHLPLIGIDVWEHAYYPQYKNDRAGYVKNIFNVINWNYAEEALDKFLNRK